MRYLVTGPGGFLGRYIVEQLLARGDSVRGFARGEYPELSALGVEMHRGDLGNLADVTKACEGIDCVIHVASKVGVWGRWFDYFRSNIHGTMNVLAACKQQGIERLVFTSSPSVAFAGRDQQGVDESTPYPVRWLSHYPHSKAIAEEMVLTANGEAVAGDRVLRTCALRPHLVWGPRDHHLTARLIERARTGQLRRVGKGTNLVDCIYVENAAEAHLQAADALALPDSPVAGKAYFLSQGEPVNCWDWVDEILALADLPPVEKSVSRRAAYWVGAAMEFGYWATRQFEREPRMMRFLALQLSTHHWYDISAARQDFGYDPTVSTSEGMQRLGDWIQSSDACGMPQPN
ncbi:NAD-dependent epimerase/dehydratase family protein [Aeoliella mucimassa]|uniref:3 beta-hydroxysteroid dehydrogenase/Delta 5-->4-isomerase n=1 Tax=Aeoliella mucimassa TaxID=2527972 RepID=A0A518AU78_9BACT|nr:NAD-dependent epimerase/dehydratase family protein [Aeoliella mucimassa]QDU58273.1 3 beta-hydroxysteroid dehydrogenase/Delta 5-->4-isomerase [Aeoliella mucimassa]